MTDTRYHVTWTEADGTIRSVSCESIEAAKAALAEAEKAGATLTPQRYDSVGEVEILARTITVDDVPLTRGGK